MWYTDGLRFECKRCGDCCRGEPGYVWVRGKDISEMAEFLEVPRKTFMKKYVRREGTRYSLKEFRNGDCVFWDDGCKIYSARPPQCRSFPFWRENLRNLSCWESAARRCPGINAGRRHPLTRMGTEGAFRELEELYGKLAQELNGLELSCSACGKCCDFRKTGHELFATKLEVYYLADQGGIPKGDISDDICPYLKRGKCSAHGVRTLGCRVFFCRKEAQELYQPIYEN